MAGVLALFAAALAQTSAQSSGALTAYDGVYAIVSVTKLTESFDFQGRRFRCRDLTGGPLTIINGQARRGAFTGAVGSHGELVMRREGSPNKSGFIFDTTFTGVIDATGMARARRSGYGCRYDYVWRKVPK